MGIEHLVKLNPKTAKLETVGFGKGLISWENVAGALAGLPVQCSWFAYAMLETHSNDAPGLKQKYTKQLVNYLAGLIWAEMLNRQFKPRARTIGEMSEGIAKAVVHCALNSNGHCNRCHGQGWVIVDGAKAICNTCDGHGDAGFSNGDKYAIAFLPCKHCHGSGVLVKDGKKVECNVCHGHLTATDTERKFYQHQCQTYDQFATKALSTIITLLRDNLWFMEGNAYGLQGCPDRYR